MLKHITPEDISQYGVVAAPDRLTGKPEDNKRIFDRLVRELVAVAVNNVIDTANELLVSEDHREEQETARVEAESARVQAEALRAAAEVARGEAETARVQAEQLRATTESVRGSNEEARKVAETARVNAETARIAAETLRAMAEEARANAERLRREAEAARNVWEEYRNTAAYKPGNKVVYQGSSYLCTAETTGHLPGDGAYWTLIAAKGVNGDGAGDMLASAYDPQGKAQDVFAYADKVGEALDSKKADTSNVYTKTESDAALSRKADSNLGYIPDGSDVLVWAEQQTRDCSFAVGASCINIPYAGFFCAHLSIGANEYRTLILTKDAPGEIWQTVHVWNGSVWSWTTWSRIATATPPVEHDLPLAAGWASFNEFGDGIKYGLCGDGKGQIMGCLISPASVTANQQVGALPSGFRPVGRQAWVHALDAYVGLDYLFRVQITGEMYSWGKAPPANATLVFPVQSFYVLDPAASQSTPVRMSVPLARMARSSLPKEPERRLMCVVDAGGAYVEFVEVKVTYDEEWQTLGALFTPYCYALKAGELLVDSDRPPHMRAHAGDDGFISPVWDLGGKVWLEAATAEEIAAWELEHPAPESQPMTTEEATLDMVADHDYRLGLLELGGQEVKA